MESPPVWKSIEALAGAFLVLSGLALFLSGMVFRMASSPIPGGWVEEVTVYLVVWGILLSTASCVAHNDHVRADFVLRFVGPRLRQHADVLADATGFLFCVAMAVFSWKTVTFALLLDERGPSYLQIPTAAYYVALPASMAACSLRYVLRLLALALPGSRSG